MHRWRDRAKKSSADSPLYGDGTLKSYGGRNCKKKVTERKKLPRGRCLKGKCVFLRKKKAPAGTLVAKPDFLRKKRPLRARWWRNRVFLRKKSPCGNAGGETGFFEEKKAPAGTLVAKPDFFEEKKRPLRARWWRFRDFKGKTVNLI